MVPWLDTSNLYVLVFYLSQAGCTPGGPVPGGPLCPLLFLARKLAPGQRGGLNPLGWLCVGMAVRLPKCLAVQRMKQANLQRQRIGAPFPRIIRPRVSLIHSPNLAPYPCWDSAGRRTAFSLSMQQESASESPGIHQRFRHGNGHTVSSVKNSPL